MLIYLGVAAAIAATYKLPYGIESAVTILAVLASMFYTMAFRLFTGLSQAELVEDVDILKMITIYMIYVTLAVVVFMSPFAYVTVFALPWLAIQTMINIISILLKLDVIGIKRK